MHFIGSSSQTCLRFRAALFPLGAVVLATSLVTAPCAMAGAATMNVAAESADLAGLGHIPDPWEGFNRSMFGLNKAADRAVLRPAAVTWRRAVPTPARDGVHNAVSNLAEPVVFLNDVFQAQPSHAVETATRFGVNSTIGVLGLFDVAANMGVFHHSADFGQTLGRYGVATGPYLVLPFFGPSSLRDAFGLAFDSFANPFDYPRFKGDWAVKSSVVVVAALDERSRVDKDLKDFQNSSTDPYAAARSIWVQNRAYQIRGDKPVDVQALPDFDTAPPPAPASPRN